MMIKMTEEIQFNVTIKIAKSIKIGESINGGNYISLQLSKICSMKRA